MKAAHKKQILEWLDITGMFPNRHYKQIPANFELAIRTAFNEVQEEDDGKQAQPAARMFMAQKLRESYMKTASANPLMNVLSGPAEPFDSGWVLGVLYGVGLLELATYSGTENLEKLIRERKEADSAKPIDFAAKLAEKRST
jgi:hypothetical protein